MTHDTSAMAPDLVEKLRTWADELRPAMVDFAQRLIRTPSLPGDERAVAEIVATEMHALGYSDVRIDEAGNVIGRLAAATQGGKRIMFNTHLDHVDVGDPDRWPYPPYAATLVGDEIWGRGASDLKGPLATQVYAGGLVLKLGLPVRNEVFVVGVTLEERGGLGSAVLAEQLPVDYVVIGEPSANRIALGHRGRYEILVTIRGRSVHASVPASGINPLYSMARFLAGVEGVTFDPDPSSPELGPSTIAPTLFRTDQTSPNVIPGECQVVLDIRNTPVDVPERVLPTLQAILDRSLTGGATGDLQVPPVTLTAYTGLTRTFWGHGAFALDRASPLAARSQSVLNAALGRDVPTQMWRFATDAGHFVEHGMAVIGFGPGHEEVIHTVDERISVAMMVEAMAGYAALAILL
jgi:succinyl-diaminopimelate desuccinylase